jgi:DNA-binding transcriptional regulator YdaS (Cro superfamily)
VFAKLSAMDLKTYISSERGRAAALAARLNGVSPSYLSQMASGKAPISPERGAEIELATDGAVTRQAMFPSNWEKIWPELVGAGSPRKPTKPRAAPS